MPIELVTHRWRLAVKMERVSIDAEGESVFYLWAQHWPRWHTLHLMLYIRRLWWANAACLVINDRGVARRKGIRRHLITNSVVWEITCKVKPVFPFTTISIRLFSLVSLSISRLTQTVLSVQFRSYSHDCSWRNSNHWKWMYNLGVYIGLCIDFEWQQIPNLHQPNDKINHNITTPCLTHY